MTLPTLAEIIGEMTSRGRILSFGPVRMESFGPGIEMMLRESDAEGRMLTSTKIVSEIALGNSVMSSDEILVYCVRRLSIELDQAHNSPVASPKTIPGWVR